MPDSQWFDVDFFKAAFAQHLTKLPRCLKDRTLMASAVEECEKQLKKSRFDWKRPTPDEFRVFRYGSAGPAITNDADDKNGKCDSDFEDASAGSPSLKRPRSSVQPPG